ncbi:Glycoside hydrolase family 65 [Teratosphaeria destructans]|uniref:alpha,alpha-trehalase n=1 Tax=Teratosphaeria destructans TaxID=418781 RepID=A0A9W7W0S1_9PEZI|nr:Glycoside hydrolase family 65 [Teratosphaeria destructans]
MLTLGLALPAGLTLALFSHHSLGKVYRTRFDGTVWDDDNWRLTTTSLDQGHYQSRASLANGYLGINVAALGPFFEADTPVDGDDINGWPIFDRRPSFATIAGFYGSAPATGNLNQTNFPWLEQYGWDSFISGVPHWSALHVAVGDSVLTASTPASEISNFSSTFDFAAGLLSWSYAWSPDKTTTIAIEYELLVHKLYVNQAATQLRLTSASDLNVTVIDALNGDGALRTTSTGRGVDPAQPVIWSAVNPRGIDNVTAYIYSTLETDGSFIKGSWRRYTDEAVIGGNTSSIAQARTLSLSAGKTSVATKYIGVASSDAFSAPDSVALNGSCTATRDGFASMLSSHRAEWASIFTADRVDSYRFPGNGSIPDDENIQELQILAITNPYYLLQNTVGSNAIAAAGNNTHLNTYSIAVGGLTSDSYAGQIFWDAEVWMAPGLVVTFPEAAQQIAKYRVKHFPQAQQNIHTAYQSSQNETGKFSPKGAVFPWTDGRFGNCTDVGPCFDYEYHINGDIGLEIYNYYVVTGDSDYFRQELFPIYDAVAQFYADLLTYNETLGLYDLYNATDPDEYANFEDNVGYTLVLIKTHLETANQLRARFGIAENTTWANISSLINVPVYEPDNIILEYQSMNNSVLVKQADIVLIDDFLDYPNNQSVNDLDYYANKQSPNGPGMTYAVFSIVANEISPSGCSSYTYDIYSSQPYIRAPWFQYSEQLVDDFTLNEGTHPAFPFLTGVGGANRVAVFGYLGLRLMLDSLNVDPQLPPQIPYLDYRDFYWQGWLISATANQTHTTLTRLPTPLQNANSTFINTSIPVTTGVNAEPVGHLAPNGSLVLLNRRNSTIQTIAGNIAQCRPVSTQQDIVQGQFPLGAIDGATSTKWEPAQLNVTSSITVKLPEPFVPITALMFDWAQAPPESYSVVVFNDTDGTTVRNVSSSSNIAISNAYNAATAAKIVAYKPNMTNVTLEQPVWSGRYVRLSIEGNQFHKGTAAEKNGTGATVAEFAVVAADGSDVAKSRRVA